MIPSTVSLEQTYVALATVLPTNLRVHASTAHLCFFQIVDHATDAEQLFVRVAALPHRLDEANSPRVFTVCLSAVQLVQALPWDRALQARPTCDVRELVALHVKDMRSTLLEVAPIAASASAAPAPQEEGTTQEEITLVPLPEIFVSCETVQEAVGDVQALRAHAHKHKQQSWARLTWLRAAIAMLRRQRSHVSQLQRTLSTSFTHLDTELRRAFVAQHRIHQPLVCARPVFIAERQVGWHVVVGVPVAAALAA